MAQKKVSEVDRFIKNPEDKFPLILLYGPDQGLVTERARLLAHNTGLALDDPFSTIRLDATEVDNDPACLSDEARTLSLFGTSRLIWIRGAGGQKGLLEAVKWLIEEPPQNTIILIEGGNLKKETGLVAALTAAKCAMVLPCYSDDGRAIDGVIDEVLDEFGMRLSRSGRALLRDHLGENRLVTRRELEKLCLYAMGQYEIGEADIMACVGNVSVNSQDQIIDALMLGNIAEVSSRFDRQLATGAPPFLIISAGMRQFQQLQQLRDSMTTRDSSAAEIVASAKPKIFWKREKTVESALKRWNSEAIAKALSRLQDCLLESRKMPHLASAILRQTLLGLTVEAARLGR